MVNWFLARRACASSRLRRRLCILILLPLFFWCATAFAGGKAELHSTLPGATQGVCARRKRRRDAPAEASADYSRYSSLLQDDTTIESQQESCRQAAARDAQPINPLLEYVDCAISGTKLRREGLDRLLADAKAGRFNRLYFFSLSRLARESIIGMPILKRLVYLYKVRIVSVSEGIDSDREGWEQIA